MSNDREEQNPPDDAKACGPWWKRLLESKLTVAIVPALLPALLGGVLVAVINTALQSDAKNREARLATYREHLNEERKTVDEVSEWVGRCVAASDHLITLTGRNFDPEQYPGLERQRTAMRQNYNDCELKWRSQQKKWGFDIIFYHHSYPGVIQSWEGVQGAIIGYMKCAEKWYFHHNTEPVEVEGACKAEKDEVEKRRDDLYASLIAARRHMWQQMESPGRPLAAPKAVPEPVPAP